MPFVPGAVPAEARDTSRHAEDTGPEQDPQQDPQQEMIPAFNRPYAGRPPRLKAADLNPVFPKDPVSPEPELESRQPAKSPAAAPADVESIQSTVEPAPSPLAASKELQQLRQMLEEQKRATLEAIQSSTQLENQLNEARDELITTQTEIVKVRKQYAAGPKGGRQDLSSNAGEIATLRASLYQAEQHLEREHNIREHEARQAKAKVSKLAGELAAVQEGHPEISPSAFSYWRGWRRIAAITAAAAVAVIGAIVYELRPPGSQTESSAPADIAPANSAPAAAAPVSNSPPLAAGIITPAGIPELAALHPTRKIDPPPPGAAAGQDFGGAVDRLENALSAFPQPEAVLRAVYKNSKECALVWNDGHPALLFGSDKGGSISLATTMSQCAHAIEQLR